MEGPVCYFTDNEVSFSVSEGRILSVGVYCKAWPVFAFAAEAAHMKVLWVRSEGSTFDKKCCSLSNFRVQTKHDNSFDKLDVLFLSGGVIPDTLASYLRSSSLCLVSDFPLQGGSIPLSWKKTQLILPLQHDKIGGVTTATLSLYVYCKNKVFRNHVRSLVIPFNPIATLSTILKSTDGTGDSVSSCSASLPGPQDFLPFKSSSDLAATVCSPCVFDKAWRCRSLSVLEQAACLDLPIGYTRSLEQAKVIRKFLQGNIFPLKLYSVGIQHMFLFSDSVVATRGGDGSAYVKDANDTLVDQADVKKNKRKKKKKMSVEADVGTTKKSIETNLEKKKGEKRSVAKNVEKLSLIHI